MEDDLRFWRYCSELSVVDAAMLIVGLNPGKVQLSSNQFESAELFERNSFGEDVLYRPENFRAVFKAMRSAIFRDELKAKVARFARTPLYGYLGDRYQEINSPDEIHVEWGLLLFNEIPYLGDNEDSRKIIDGKIYIVKEPDWHNSTVTVDELKEWLKTKNDRPAFFFPESQKEAFQNPDNPRYAPKLAAVVDAWNAVTEALPNKSVKQTLEKWLREHAVNYGLVDEDGLPLTDAVSELAKVANWAPKGGAPKTAASPSEPGSAPQSSNYTDLRDDWEIPF